MKSRWVDVEAGASPLEQCVYGSRLLGSDPSLVLHGGGNTSIKGPFLDITGIEIDALFVKGSGWDLATIAAAGFSPLRQRRLHELLELEAITDQEMMRELSAARLDPGSPQPSVESLLHGFLPYPAVQHSHADVIVALTNTTGGEALVREVYADSVIVIPYIMPGFDLARLVRKTWPVDSAALGMVLMNHGLFTFGETTRDAYERHVALITKAEMYLGESAGPSSPLPPVDPIELAEIRSKISSAAETPMIVRRQAGGEVARFVARPDLADLATRGPLTPDHVIRTKRVPLIGREVDRFVADYVEYFEANQKRTGRQLQMLDPAPRVVLDPQWGMLTAGRTASEADIAADIYHHTISVLEQAEDRLGGYRALGPEELFDCEYWDLEQAKLTRSGPPPEFAGMVALVTGAASGIGKACAVELLDRGAAVVGIDIDDASVVEPRCFGLQVDVTEHLDQQAAIAQAVERYGGIDIAVIGAGVFGETQAVGELDLDTWDRVMAVNVRAVGALLRDLQPFLQLSPVGGRVAVIASRNATAPGKGAAAYSASKAALTQLARVAALEWAESGIRVNIVHPDGVFDTGLWTDDLIRSRAAAYGMGVDEYKRRNLLHTEVSAQTVAGIVADLCSDRYRATTGAQIPIDGGNERVI